MPEDDGVIIEGKRIRGYSVWNVYVQRGKATAQESRPTVSITDAAKKCTLDLLL